MNENHLLSCSNISKYYQEGKFCIKVLRNINLTIERGEMIAVVGSSGSGKSTLLHILGGLDKPTYGEVIFEGKSINKLSDSSRAIIRNRYLGFVYQFHHLLLDFTVLENVAMPLLISGFNSSKAQKIALEMLSAVGLKKHSHHKPAELSGGEKQRVSIARALINHPTLVLADEPTGNLDQNNAHIVFELLHEINERLGTAFLVVTHDLRLAKQLHKQLEICNGSLQIQPTAFF